MWRRTRAISCSATGSFDSRSPRFQAASATGSCWLAPWPNPPTCSLLDEPTNDLDMETLDLLEDLLADYDGTLLLVSHDRDFIDRLASSTIALDGRGHAVETPGGWTDFMRQNPDFFEGRYTAAAPPTAAAKAPPTPAAPPPKPVKLTFKDQHRLGRSRAAYPRLCRPRSPSWSRSSTDPALFTRDPARFDQTMKAIDVSPRFAGTGGGGLADAGGKAGRACG